MPNAPVLHLVPFGSQSKRCECGRQIYFVESPKVGGGVTRTPIDCNVEGGEAPRGPGDPGRGINHFINCELRDRFRKKATHA